MSSNSDNATALAENKVLILYILNLIDNDIRQDDLFKIITSINNINYFYFKQILTDLIDSKLVGIHTKEEINKIVKKFGKINDIGIRCVNYKFFLNIIVKLLIFLGICIVR